MRPIAVVVATRDRGGKVVRLIESVLANGQQNFEMVIVDQSTGDQTEAAVAPFLDDPRIRYMRSSESGVSCGRNLGISMTTAPLIAITDDDCIVPSDWLTGIATTFDSQPRVGVVFCTVDAVPVDAPGLTPTIHFDHNRVIDSVFMAWRFSGGGLALGAGMALRRATFDDVDGFDELLGPGARFGACEDNDLSWRALIAGWWTYQNSEVVVIHDGFRNLEELRILVVRDFFGVGGAIAKYLRTGNLRILRLLIVWIVRFGLVEPGRDVIAGRRPRGLRRPYLLMRGLLAGLRTPMNRSQRVYLANSHCRSRPVDATTRRYTG